MQHGAPEIGVFTYDGDTPSDARRAIRGKAHVVLSNPDMLHSGILPHHPRWAKLFENLRFVVIDELHAYRGVFGSHLANIMRRLQRICRHYGSDPVFICSSATIANPQELAEGLTGSPFELVEKNGAPRGEKFFLFVNPPVVNAELGIRRSYLAETRRVALEFLRHNLQLIVFAQSRLAVEILTTYLKRSEEHTSELQSQSNLVCRLLLEKKKTTLGLTCTVRQLRPRIWLLPTATPTCPRTLILLGASSYSTRLSSLGCLVSPSQSSSVCR